MISKFEAIDRASKYSTEKLGKIRRSLSRAKLGDDVSVVITGSFGRKEASGESDVDFFLIHNSRVKAPAAKSYKRIVESKINRLVPKPPAEDGAFNATASVEELVKNIGGTKESNQMMTRRMLLMLEGACIYNEVLFNDIRRQILNRYISPKITNHQLALFFLNDVIRYYRTMCVDFEYKTVEQQKPWGIRNLKLMYSRKLLYFGGVLAVAESAQRGYEAKMKWITDLLQLTPLERVRGLFGTQANECLGFYDRFLERISDVEFRKSVAKVTIERDTHTAEFRALKDEAQHFGWALQRLLESRYVSGHPIHRALIF